MKQLFCFLLIFIFSSLSAAQNPTQLPGTKLAPIKPLQSPQKQPQTQSRPSTPQPMPARHQNIPPHSFGVVFTSPGVVSYRDNSWVGREDLYNVPTDIGLYIEVVQSKNVNDQPFELDIRERVTSGLKLSNINVRDSGSPDGTPLPFLHVLVMIEGIEKGFTCYCAARLFEQTQLKRVFLPKGIFWQVITWEKQELIVSPTEQLRLQLLGTVEGIIKSFTDHYREQNANREKR